MPLLPKSRGKAAIEVALLLDASATEYIASLVQAGCLVSIYRTSDGGALGVAVTLDGEQEKEWFRDAEGLADWLRDVDQAVSNLPPPAPSVKRPRRGS